MAKKPDNPLLRLFKKLSLKQGQSALRQLTMTGAECRACHTPHLFPGPLVGLPILEKIMLPVRIVLHELEVNSEGNSWNHAGLISPVPSEQAGGPIYFWQSGCPLCHRTGIGNEIRNAYQALKARGRQPTDLSKCFRCGTTNGQHIGASIRGGFQIDTPDGMRPMGGIEFFELDPRSDWNKNPRPPERWRFIGILDVSKGDDVCGEYLWKAECPKCVAIDMPNLAIIPTMGLAGRA